jgi:polysaccharide biosynthesis/export protein
MTLLFSRAVRARWPALALCLSLSALSSHAQRMDGGSFVAPGYAATAASGVEAESRNAPNVDRADRLKSDEKRPQSMRTEQKPPVSPPRPNEFQKFVAAATGRQLPVFGASFFESALDGSTPADNVPVSADYIVGTGDEMLVRVWGSIAVDYRTTVDRNGMVNLPKVGSFSVTGVKASELEKHLRAQIGRIYTNFNLNVSLGQLRGVKVFVVGPAQTPGAYTLASQSTLLSAVVMAGGPGPNGSMRKVLLRRDGQTVSELDVYDFLVQGDKSKDLQLAPGDVVVFQPAGPRVALNGALNTPGIYELKTGQETLREVLRYAGGLPVLTNPNRAQLERIDPARQPAARYVEEFKLDDAGQQKPLRDGDVLTLLAISPQFANEVTLKGHVAQPLRTPFTPGMRIRDLIPNREALISPDFYRRKNLLVQALKGPEPTVAGDDNDRAQLREDRVLAQQAKKSPAALFEDLNWDYAIVERLNEADLSTQVLHFNLGKAVLDQDEAHNLVLRAGDVVTIFSQKDIRVPVARQTRLVSLEGEVVAPGVYQLLPGETLPQLIQRAGGLTPQAYVYGLELTREETRLRQQANLAAAVSRLEALAATQSSRDVANQRDPQAIQLNASSTQLQLSRLNRVKANGRIALELEPTVSRLEELPDLPLENADRVSVPARPGFITVSGAVSNNNSFIWRGNRNAGDYLKLAGVEEEAERSAIFILRADGTVDHATNHTRIFGAGGIASAKMYPGDALVVPSQVDFETWNRSLVRNLKDWTQIFAQFGLGAVALKSFKN